jgi:hypothetical protein
MKEERQCPKYSECYNKWKYNPHCTVDWYEDESSDCSCFVSRQEAVENKLKKLF